MFAFFFAFTLINVHISLVASEISLDNTKAVKFMNYKHTVNTCLVYKNSKPGFSTCDSESIYQRFYIQNLTNINNMVKWNQYPITNIFRETENNRRMFAFTDIRFEKFGDTLWFFVHNSKDPKCLTEKSYDEIVWARCEKNDDNYPHLETQKWYIANW